jgi:hypothetical protein
MKKDNLDFDIIFSFAMEISDRFKLIKDYFPKENEKLLKHAAASAIHLTLFIADLINHAEFEKIEQPKNIKEFLENCGCNFNKKD